MEHQTPPTESAAILTDEQIKGILFRGGIRYSTLQSCDEQAAIAFAREVEADLRAALAVVAVSDPSRIDDSELPPLPFTARSTKDDGSLYVMRDLLDFGKDCIVHYGVAKCVSAAPVVLDDERMAKYLLGEPYIATYIQHLESEVHAADALKQAAPVVLVDRNAAADFIDAKAQKYIDENASSEHDTGAVVFHYGEAGRDYHSTLVELAEEIRALKLPASLDLQTAIKALEFYSDGLMDDGSVARVAISALKVPISASPIVPGPAVPSPLQVEALKLAPILRGMCEGGGEERHVDIYSTEYQPGDGDVFVTRAAAILEEIAVAPAVQDAPSDEQPCRNASISNGATVWPKSCLRCGIRKCPDGIEANFGHAVAAPVSGEAVRPDLASLPMYHDRTFYKISDVKALLGDKQ